MLAKGALVPGGKLLAIVALLCCIATPALAEKRVALVIGVGAYQWVGQLANPVSDAKLVAKSLRSANFEVTEVLNPDYSQLTQALAVFRHNVEGADVAIVYYAGHGVEVNGANWLLPTSAKGQSPEDLQFEAIRSSTLVDLVRDASKVRLVILDACRNNPFAASRAWSVGGRGLTRGGLAHEPLGTGNVVVLLATQAGETAADGQGRTNSPFASALAKLVDEPALRLSSLPGRLSREVKATTGYEQSPDQQGIFDEPDWMFVPGAVQQASTGGTGAASAPFDYEFAAWDMCSRSSTTAPCERYLQKYPSGRFRELAQDRMHDLTTSAPVSKPAMVAKPEIVAALGIVVVNGDPGEILVKTVQPDSRAMGQLFGGDIILQVNSIAPDGSVSARSFLENALAPQGRVKLLVQRGPTTTVVVLRTH